MKLAAKHSLNKTRKKHQDPAKLESHEQSVKTGPRNRKQLQLALTARHAEGRASLEVDLGRCVGGIQEDICPELGGRLHLRVVFVLHAPEQRLHAVDLGELPDAAVEDDVPVVCAGARSVRRRRREDGTLCSSI